MKTLLHALLLFLYCYFTPSSVFAQGSEKALRLDGQDDFVYFDRDNRGITNEVTVEAWVMTTSTKLQLVTAKYDRDAELGYQLVMRDGKAAFSGRDGSGVYRISGYSPSIINDGRWHHLAGVSKDGIWSIYIDGILESSFDSGYLGVNLASNAPFTVGNYYMVNNDFFQGQVDELKVWKKGLTEDEIRMGMCQKANEKNPDLVVYLKFDEGTGSTVKDHSSYGINGTFRNMSPATAWVTSGAPIGDRSVYRYSSNWTQSLDMVTDFGAFFVRRAIAGTKAFHIYHVISAPNHTNGIPDPNGVKDYYGIFKVGGVGFTYEVWFPPSYLSCGATLYRREDNAATPWVQVAESSEILGLAYQSTAHYGEYIAIEKKFLPIEISGPTNICPGERATLSIKPTNGTVLWNTGAKTNSLEVTQSGTYTVVVTENGCQRSASITLETECPLIPNIITPNGDGKNDTFVLEGINIDQVEIEIFDRWGIRVFKRSTYDNQWATTTAGMYYYYIKNNQTGREYKGWVEVVR